MRVYKLFFILLIILFLSASLFGLAYAFSSYAQWGESVGAGANNSSIFNAVASDKNGNIYAAGEIDGTGSFDFGNGVSVSGPNANSNPVIVKYNSSGKAQWAISTGSGSGSGYFPSVAEDANGNIYALGQIAGSTASFDFGNGVTVTTGSSTGNYYSITKYNSLGKAQWAILINSQGDNNHSSYSGITTDTNGNIYIVGEINAQYGSYSYGNGVSVTGGYSGFNTVIIKYNSSGLAQWANSTGAGAPKASSFDGVSTDSNNNVYAVGDIQGNGSYSFGNSISVAGGDSSSFYNAVIVKYNSSGLAQWANSTSAGAPGQNQFYAVTSNSSGNVYAVGTLNGNGSFNFGNSVTVSGGYNGSGNPVIVKYSSSGVAQWANSTASGTYPVDFFGVTDDSVGNVYAVGELNGSGNYDFGNSVTLARENAGNNSVVIVKYNSSDQTQWANSTSPSAQDMTYFNGVTNDLNGNIYAVGDLYGSTSFDFGNGVTVAGGSIYDNSLIINYSDSPSPTATPTSSPTPTPTPSSSSTATSRVSSGASYTPVSCTNFSPQGSPTIYKISAKRTSATFFFTPLSSPVDTYIISYGLNSYANQYSAQVDTHNPTGAISYTLNQLSPGKTYYVRVRAMNGCMPGVWGNTVSIFTGNNFTNTGTGTAQLAFAPTIPTATPSAQTSTQSSSSPKPTSPSQSFNSTRTFSPIINTLSTISDKTDTAITNLALVIVKPLPKIFEQPLILGISSTANNTVARSVASLLLFLDISAMAYSVFPEFLTDLFSFFEILSDIPLYIVRLFTLIVEVLHIKKRPKPWGVVFDAKNGQPIDPAIVLLSSLPKSIATPDKNRITDIQGRFGFLVQKGLYKLMVKKTDYEFPSKILTGHTQAHGYTNLYFGENVEVKDADVVTVNIPMDPVRTNWNQQVKDKYYKPYREWLRENTLNKIFLGSIFFNLVVYALYPTVLNFILMVIFVVVVVIHLLSKPRKWGVVYNSQTQQLIPHVVVKAKRLIAGKEIDSGSTTTDEQGRYYLLLFEGTGYLQAEQTMPDGTVKILGKTSTFTIKKPQDMQFPDIRV